MDSGMYQWINNAL